MATEHDIDPILRALLVCPLDHGELEEVAQTLLCTECGRVFPVENGVPDMVVQVMG